jgi:predicted enzyme related to lactoylglutathione lyase
MGETGSYTTIVLADRPVGGILDMAERGVPEMIPAHWQVYFGVEDTDATIQAAKQAGGSVMVEPIDIPAGRFSILTDPHGAGFAVIALSGEAQENA